MLSRRRLTILVWGADREASPDTIKQYIQHLRRKLEPDPDHLQRILARWGEGYLFLGTAKPA